MTAQSRRGEDGTGNAAAGRRPIQILTGLSFGWLVIGFVGFWRLIVTTGAHGGPALLAFALWVGPIVLLSIPHRVGSRGPFRDWWWPRRVVRSTTTASPGGPKGRFAGPRTPSVVVRHGVRPWLPSRNRPAWTIAR